MSKRSFGSKDTDPSKKQKGSQGIEILSAKEIYELDKEEQVKYLKHVLNTYVQTDGKRVIPSASEITVPLIIILETIERTDLEVDLRIKSDDLFGSAAELKIFQDFLEQIIIFALISWCHECLNSTGLQRAYRYLNFKGEFPCGKQGAVSLEDLFAAVGKKGVKSAEEVLRRLQKIDYFTHCKGDYIDGEYISVKYIEWENKILKTHIAQEGLKGLVQAEEKQDNKQLETIYDVNFETLLGTDEEADFVNACLTLDQKKDLYGQWSSIIQSGIKDFETDDIETRVRNLNNRDIENLILNFYRSNKDKRAFRQACFNLSVPVQPNSKPNSKWFNLYKEEIEKLLEKENSESHSAETFGLADAEREFGDFDKAFEEQSRSEEEFPLNPFELPLDRKPGGSGNLCPDCSTNLCTVHMFSNLKLRL